MVSFLWLSDYTTNKLLLFTTRPNLCTALVAKLATCLKNVVAKKIFTHHGNQNGRSLEPCLRGKNEFEPHPQNEILVPFRGYFQNFQWSPLSLLYGSSPFPRANYVQYIYILDSVSLLICASTDTEEALMAVVYMQQCCKFTVEALWADTLCLNWTVAHTNSVFYTFNTISGQLQLRILFLLPEGVRLQKLWIM